MMSLLQSAPAGTPWIVALVAVVGVLATMIKAWAVLRKVELEGGNAKANIEADAEAQLRADLVGSPGTELEFAL